MSIVDFDAKLKSWCTVMSSECIWCRYTYVYTMKLMMRNEAANNEYLFQINEMYK